MDHKFKTNIGKIKIRKKKGSDRLVLVVIERMKSSVRGQPQFPKQAGSVLSDPFVTVLSKLHFSIKFLTSEIVKQ
jgi:hypothetical protein